MIDMDMAAFDLHHRSLGLAPLLINEVNYAINASVSSLPFLAHWLGPDEAQRPPLELVAVLLGQGTGGGKILRLTDDLKPDTGEGILKALTHHCNGEVSDVNSNPAPPQLLGSDDGGAAAAEGIEDYIPLV